MLFYHEYVVRKHERGLLFKKGDFVRFLAPGTYRLFGTRTRYRRTSSSSTTPRTCNAWSTLSRRAAAKSR
jgi:hypothetical protein